MTAPTHIVFASVLYLYLAAVLRIPLALGDAFLAAGASLLPDLDTSASAIGWRLRPISSWIEKRFGHRTLTHSFVGTIGIAVVALPLALAGWAGYGMFVMGYFSHPFLDIFNKEGVQIYWPNQKWGIFPGKEEQRIAVGSGAEHVLLCGLVAVGLLLYPIASVGLNRTLHWALADVGGAVSDYYAFSPDYEVHAELEGVFRKIDNPVQGTFRVVDALNEYSLLVEINGRPCIVGTSDEAHVVPTSVRVVKGERITHFTQLLPMDGRTLGELSRLAGVEHRLFGTVRTLSHFDLRAEVVSYNPITRAGATLTLDHATYTDIEQMGLKDLPILSSNLLVKTILPVDRPFAPFSFSQTATTVFPVRVPIAAKSDVQVQPGDQIDAGALIAAHSGKLRDITLAEAELETARKLRFEQSAGFARDDQELAREIEVVETEIAGLGNQIEAYTRSLGFEREIGDLRQKVEALKTRRQSLLNKRREVISKDREDRLRYEQKVAELLAKKDALEASAYTRAEFEAEIVNAEFEQNTCILYLRRLTAEENGGDDGSATGAGVAVH